MLSLSSNGTRLPCAISLQETTYDSSAAAPHRWRQRQHAHV